MKTAQEIRRATQELWELPPPRLGNFGERTRDWFEKLASAPGESPWPPREDTTLLDLQQRIISAAEEFLGLTEIRSNAEWDNLDTPGKDASATKLREAMIATGWQTGWAYCMAFCEVCWRAGYLGRPEFDTIRGAITPSVMETFSNFNALGKISRDPQPGAIFFKQRGSSWQGHGGIVIGVRDGRVLTIEANTSPQPGSAEAEREGDGVYAKHWSMSFVRSASSLWLRGFVNPFIAA